MHTQMPDVPLHPSDDDLVLLFYGELPESRHVEVTGHLASCAACRDSYHALTRTLHLTSTTQAPDPGVDFEARVWSRLEPALPAQPVRRLSILAAAAAALIVAAGGVWFALNRTPPAPTAAQPPTVADSRPGDQFRERVLLSAVDAHLVQTEMLFVELLNAPIEGPPALGYARLAADDLVASGRLYRETARDAGDAYLVAMLDELEPVLIEVARSSDTPDTGDMSALRGRIEQDDLLFKVRAVSADIQDRQGRTSAGEGAL